MKKIISLILMGTLTMSLTACGTIPIKNEKIIYYEFSQQENQKLAESLHINTDNEKVNEVINKMLNAMMTQNTVEIETNYESRPSFIYKYDINNSVLKSESENLQYYQNYNTKQESEVLCLYEGESPNFQKICGKRGRQDMLRELSNINALYEKNNPELNNVTVSIEEDLEYVVTFTFKRDYGSYSQEITDVVYINKDTYLIEKIDSEWKEIFSKDDVSTSHHYSTYKYTNEEIKIPKKMVKNAQEVTYATDKPVIYLYPKETTQVDISLNWTEGHIKTSYPKYNDGWHVTATPDGKITDKSGRNYDYLFYDGMLDSCPEITEGFVVEGSKSIEFLEYILHEYGLTEKEANEFIVYWAPYLEENDFNLISFQNEWFDSKVELNVSPAPNTIFRLFMVYEPLNKPINIPKQKVKPFERNGFTVVEWGGIRN